MLSRTDEIEDGQQVARGPRQHGTPLLVLLIALVFPTLSAWAYFIALASEGGQNRAQQVTYAAAKIVQFALPLFCLFVFERRKPRYMAPTGEGLLLGLGFGVLVAAAMLGLYHFALRDVFLAGTTSEKIRQKLEQFDVPTPARYLGLAVFVSGVHSLAEEYYWRWFVFGRLRERVPPAAALIVSSLAFMGHHVIVLAVYFPGQFWLTAVPFSLGVAVGGAVWAWLYQRTGSLLATWLSHLLVDAAILAIGYDLVFAS